MDARIITSSNGMVLDTFVILEQDGQAADSRRVQEITSTLQEKLARPEARPGRVTRRPPRRLRHFPVRPQVTFSEDGPNGRTVMEVVATDCPGLLSRIAVAMARCAVRVQNAKIATYGERAEDVFFITDRDNRPLDPDLREQCRAKVIKALSGN